MKKQLIIAFICSLTLVPFAQLFAQSTEGTDFWVTLMRGDERQYDSLFLSFSAKEATKVYIANTQTPYYDTVELGDNAIKKLKLNSHESSCYVTDTESEQPAYRALHVTSDKPISLIAANYKNKSFDVAAILPTKALMSEYRIQCYTPYAHEDNEQGSHFAIVAADDNVVVDFILTENSVVLDGSGSDETSKLAGVTYTTDTLKQGQVYYVWSGQNKKRDFTGSVIKARQNKKIAVFNGNSHTNIGKVRDRDHVYSQAMPVNYWGKRFAITSSLTTIDGKSGYWERIDKIRVQALVDGTVVRIDGDSVYTFNFANNPKHYYEFDFGAKDDMTNYSGDGHPYVEGVAHYIETSCPSAVHLFMTSDRYDHEKIKNVNDKYCNGDPSEIWINPVEQKIKKLTFGTFQTKLVKDHFINIVTTADNVASVVLDGDDISAKFKPFPKNPEYMYARIDNVIDGAHTLSADSGFIAHVYGFGEKESYGYPAGGETKDLTAFVVINGDVYKPGDDNLICGDDNVTFGCELNYDYDSIYWSFGDGQDSLCRTKIDSVKHYYAKADVYNAYVLIYRHMGDDDGCVNFDAKDSIAFLVNIGNFKIGFKNLELPYCSKEGDVVDMKIHLDNPAGVSLTSDSVSIVFNAATKAAGFDEKDIRYEGDSVLIIRVPATAKDKTEYGLHLHIGSKCPNSVLDKDTTFKIQYDIPVLAQRFNNVLGVLRDSFPTQTLSDFVWIHNGDTLPDQHNSVLFLDGENPDNSGEYFVCFDISEDGKETIHYCTCPVVFQANTTKPEFSEDPMDLSITATYIIDGQMVFVNADWKGKTDIECYAQWIDVSGNVLNGEKHTIPDGGCTIPVPAENGFYILRVTTDGAQRSFKFIINH